MSNPANFASSRALWRRCRAADAPFDEAARFLDLAAFADGRLDEEERARVDFLLASDPDFAADVAAARMLCSSGDAAPTEFAQPVADVIVRAASLVVEAATGRGQVLRFGLLPVRPLLQRFAQWGSLAAALVVASWLGFAMGSGASLTLSQPALTGPPDQTSPFSEAGFLPELLDPTTGFLRDLATGQQT